MSHPTEESHSKLVLLHRDVERSSVKGELIFSSFP
jgi:hypothetical protein